MCLVSTIAIAVSVMTAARGTSECLDPFNIRAGHLTHVVMHPSGEHVYAIAQGTDDIVVVDTATQCAVGVIKVPSESAFGAMPYRASVTPDGAYMYTANMGDDTISVIDLGDNAVIDTIAVQDIPWDVHVTADGGWVLAALGNAEIPEQARAGIAVIDPESRRLVRTLPLSRDELPFAISSTPDGEHALIATQYPRPDGWHARLHILKTETWRRIQRVDLGRVKSNWGRIAVSDDGSTVYVSSGQQVERLSVVDIDSGQLKTEVSIPTEATEIVASPCGDLLYLLSPGSHRLYSLDLNSSEVETVLDLNTVFTGQWRWASGDMRGLAIDPEGSRLYIGAFEAEAVVTVDTAGRQNATVIPLNDYRTELWDIVVSPDGERVFVGENAVDPRATHSVIVIDVLSRQIIERVPLEGGGSVGMTLTPDGRFLYVAQLGGTVTEIDVESLTVERRFHLLPRGVGGGMASDVAVTPDGMKLYASLHWRDGAEGDLAVVDLQTGAIIERVDFDWLPGMLAVSRDGNRLAVARHGAQAQLGDRFNPADVEWFTEAGIVLIDPHHDQITASVTPSDTYAPSGRVDLLAFDNAGERVYFYASRDEIGVLNLRTTRMQYTIELRTGRHGPVGVHPSSIGFNMDGTMGYVPCGDSYLLAVVDLRWGRVTDWLKLGIEPVAAVVTPDDRLAFVTNRRSEEVSVVDLSANTLLDSISTRQELAEPPLPKVVEFADPRLQEAVRDATGLTGPEVTADALTELTRLDARELGIEDLSGLEHATRLNWLDLSGNRVVDLSPLANLTGLRELFLDRNQLTDITHLAGLVSLERLSIAENMIVEITALAELENLQALDAFENRIRDIEPLTGLSKLASLHLGGNGIVDLSPLSSLESLQWLHIWGNRIDNVQPLSALSQLNELHLGTNQITSIDPLAELTELRSLWLHQNHIQDISPLAALVDAGGLGRGAYVDVKNNRLDLSAGSRTRAVIQELEEHGVAVDYRPQR